MGVKINKYFNDSVFQSFSEKEKILFIYLSTHTNLNSIGVLILNLDILCLQLNYSMKDLRIATQTLIDKKYIYVKKFNNVLYFIIPAHFTSIPKSESSILKVQKDLKSLPIQLVQFLESIGITSKSKVREFTKPAPEEVTQYALSMGYIVQGQEFINYYEGQAERYGKNGLWVDGRGKEVRDWKAKMRRVWFKEENKIRKVQGAPEGFERFYIEVDGKAVFPDGWRRGEPYSKNIAMDIKLKEKYNKVKNDK